MVIKKTLSTENQKIMKRYLHLTNKRYSLILGILLICFSSCNEEILEEEPFDFFSPGNAFLTEQGVS